MGKRLMMLMLAVVLMAGMSGAAYAEIQNIRIGGEITALAMMRDLWINDSEDAATEADRSEGFASISRVRFDADLTDNIAATVQLLNERYWGTETANASASGENGNVAIDLAFVDLKEFLYSPMTIRVGRQNLRFGDAMLIGDPDTNNAATTASAFGNATSGDPDLSVRKAFDAFRATLDYDPLTIDAFYSEVSEGTINTQDDINLYGVNLNYALTDATMVEGYYFGRYTGREGNTGNKPDRVDALGGRLVTSPMDNLKYQLEAAIQLGKDSNANAYVTADRRAWAIETSATYMFEDMDYTPALSLGYGYFTGQKGDDSKHCRAWDPMYEDQKFGDIANALFNQTNVHILGMSGSIKPADDVTLMASTFGFWWDKKYWEGQAIADVRGNTLIMKEKKYAATELDLKAIYDYTEDVQFCLLSGILWPGGSVDGQNDTTATEVIGSMKVVF